MIFLAFSFPVYSLPTFVKLQSGKAGFCHLAFAELSKIVYQLFQKIKISSALPVIEKREAYSLRTFRILQPSRKSGTCRGPRSFQLLRTSKLIFKSEFCKECHRFLDDFFGTNCRSFSGWAGTESFFFQKISLD